MGMETIVFRILTGTGVALAAGALASTLMVAIWPSAFLRAYAAQARAMGLPMIDDRVASSRGLAFVTRVFSVTALVVTVAVVARGVLALQGGGWFVPESVNAPRSTWSGAMVAGAFAVAITCYLAYAMTYRETFFGVFQETVSRGGPQRPPRHSRGMLMRAVRALWWWNAAAIVGFPWALVGVLVASSLSG